MEGMTQGNRLQEWPHRPIAPMYEQNCQTSSHAQSKGTTRIVAVVRASAGLPTPPVGSAQGCEPSAVARGTAQSRAAEQWMPSQR